MNLTASIGGVSRSPLIAGSTITLRRPVSSAALLLDDPDGSLSISTLDAVIIQVQPATITEDEGLPGALLPGAWLPGGGTPTDYPAATIFSGYVTAVNIDPRGRASAGSRLLKVDCVDLNWRLDNCPAYLTKSYSNTTDQAILLDALSETGLSSIITADSGTVDSIESGITVAFDGATMRDVLDEMARISGGVWWVDAGTLYYSTESAATAASWDIDTDSPDDSATFDVQKLTVMSRHDFPLNSVTVVGPANDDGVRATASASDATSISAYGTFNKKIEVKTATVDSYAQIAADQLVAAGKDPRQTIKFEFDDEDGRGLTVNEKITATSARFGLSSQAFVVREVRIQQLKGAISAFAVEAGDFRPTVTDILRRIDANSKSSTNLPRTIRGLDFLASSSRYVASGTSIANIDDLTQLSLMATIRVDSFSGTDVVVAKDDGSNLGWKLEVSATTITLTRTKTSSNYIYSRSHAFATGTTYRIVVTSSDTTGARFWINGTEQTTLGGSSLGTGSFDSEASSPLRIARNNAGNYFDGFVGAVALWDFALPETTAKVLHNAKFTALPFPSNLQLAWALDEFEVSASASGADTIRDRSTNNYNGTPTNGPVGDSVVYISDS